MAESPEIAAIQYAIAGRLSGPSRVPRTSPRLVARDLARVLRALDRAGGDVSRIEQYLDVRDERTLAALLERAGLATLPIGRPVRLVELVLAQRFIAVDHPVIQALLKRLAD